MKNQLKNCPFCGADKPDVLAHPQGKLIVCRIRCGCQMVVIKSGVSTAWNRRLDVPDN